MKERLRFRAILHHRSYSYTTSQLDYSKRSLSERQFNKGISSICQSHGRIRLSGGSPLSDYTVTAPARDGFTCTRARRTVSNGIQPVRQWITFVKNIRIEVGVNHEIVKHKMIIILINKSTNGLNNCHVVGHILIIIIVIKTSKTQIKFQPVFKRWFHV